MTGVEVCYGLASLRPDVAGHRSKCRVNGLVNTADGDKQELSALKIRVQTNQSHHDIIIDDLNEAVRRVRYVEEGDGATLSLMDANALRIATDKVRTCVSVYFQVNHTQCFVAHIDARTPEVWPELAVSIAGGLEIGSQVKRRLYGFLRQDDSDIKHPQFGRRLMFQSPNNTARTYQGIDSPSTSWFVVRAIRAFFEACSKTLYEEVESLDDELRQYNQPDHRRGRERDELAEKADFLQNISVSTPIHTELGLRDKSSQRPHL